MSQSNCNTTKRTFTHLSDIQRGKLEVLAKEGKYTQVQIANEPGVSQLTISRELKRGRIRQMNSKRTYIVKIENIHVPKTTINIQVIFSMNLLMRLTIAHVEY